MRRPSIRWDGNKRFCQPFSQPWRQSQPKSHAGNGSAEQRPNHRKYTEAYGLADLRSLLRWSTGSGLFYD